MLPNRRERRTERHTMCRRSASRTETMKRHAGRAVSVRRWGRAVRTGGRVFRCGDPVTLGRFQKFCSHSEAPLISERQLSPHPGPLPWGEGESFDSQSRKAASGLARRTFETPESFACCSLSPRERVRVRGKVCPLSRWLQFKLIRPSGRRVDADSIPEDSPHADRAGKQRRCRRGKTAMAAPPLS